MKILFPLSAVAILLLSSCSKPIDNEETEDLAPLPELSCVAVIPTTIPLFDDTLQAAAQIKKMTAAATIFDTVLQEELGGTDTFQLLNNNQLTAIIENPDVSSLQQIHDIAGATGCGAILKVDLTRYRERVGGEMSVATPASVAFSMELIGMQNGIVFWATSFDETQKALLEDIFSFDKAQKRGFKWLSARELSTDGLKERLRQFPYFQKIEE